VRCVTAAAAVVALASCGVGPRHTLNAQSVGNQIGAQLATTYSIGIPAVTCPSGVPVHAGQTFVCTTTLDGQAVDIDGTVTSGSGKFTFVPTKAVLVVKTLTKILTMGISRQTHLGVVVDCGTHAVLVAAVGRSLTCSATVHGERPRHVTVTVLNLLGSVRYVLGRPT
jgi:Domain of unknown function (DUF4333)